MTEEIKINSIEHIAYEINMFYFSYDLFLKNIKLKNGISNVCLESFLVHLRILIEFFFFDRNEKFPDDLLAIDYFDNDFWKENRFILSTENINRDVKNQIDKQLSHLTVIRTENKREWKCQLIHFDMSRVIKFFSDNLKEPYLSKYKEHIQY